MLLIELILLIGIFIYSFLVHIKLNKTSFSKDTIDTNDANLTAPSETCDIDSNRNSYMDNTGIDYYHETFCPSMFSEDDSIVLDAIYSENCPWCDERNSCSYNISNEINQAGQDGEDLVYDVLNSKFPSPINLILRDLYIPTKNNKHSQIDLIFIHSTGIYVIESKNWNKVLSGNFDSPMIVAEDTYSTDEYFNPIIQNNSHIKHLKNFLIENNLSHSTINFYSVIAFSDKCDYSNFTNIPDNVIVSSYSSLGYSLYEFISTKANYKNIISLNIQQKIFNVLQPCTNISTEIKSNHLLNVKAIIEDTKY